VWIAAAALLISFAATIYLATSANLSPTIVVLTDTRRASRRPRRCAVSEDS
jgi:predicted ATPase with chaperone activity